MQTRQFWPGGSSNVVVMRDIRLIKYLRAIRVISDDGDLIFEKIDWRKLLIQLTKMEIINVKGHFNWNDAKDIYAAKRKIQDRLNNCNPWRADSSNNFFNKAQYTKFQPVFRVFYTSPASQIAQGKKSRYLIEISMQQSIQQLNTIYVKATNPTLTKKERQKLIKLQQSIHQKINATIKQSKNQHDQCQSKLVNVIETNTPFDKMVFPYPPPIITKITKHIHKNNANREIPHKTISTSRTSQ